MKYRKKSRLTEATQWFKTGDHPQDGEDEPKVVQAYPELDIPPENRFCPDCGNLMERHGFLQGLNDDEIICPGDYIITNRTGAHFRMGRGEFESQYELYAPPPRPSQTPKRLSDLEELKLRQRTEKHGV